MLNCTLGVECILHEHNQHHGHNTHLHITGSAEEDPEVGSPPYEILDVNEVIQGLLNDTDSELSELEHLDAPNEGVYMMCGVLIAMVLVGLIIVLLAVTISKLRKRGDSESSSHHSSQTAPTPMALLGNNPTLSTSASAPAVLATSVVHMTTHNGDPPLSNLYQPPGLWHYPAAHFLYATEQDVTITALPTERPGFCRGMRKNLGGRWKRLVKRKTVPDSCAVSRDHLKQIYVY